MNKINPARAATAVKKSRCIKSKDGNHKWKETGEVPGAQEECVYCNKVSNWKEFDFLTFFR